jgi:hypothetical protein
MPRRASRQTPFILSGYLYTNDAYTGTRLDSPPWFAWLTTATSFYYAGRQGTFTAHCERRQRGGLYWTAYRRQRGVLRRVYLGKNDQLTAQRLAEVALLLNTLPPLKGDTVTLAPSHT